MVSTKEPITTATMNNSYTYSSEQTNSINNDNTLVQVPILEKQD